MADVRIWTGTEWVSIVGPKGDPGADGADGAPGADGSTPTVAIGTVTTGAPGTQATVTNTGTAEAAVFAFSIPAGADGAPGADGKDGKDGVDGKDGSGVTIQPPALTWPPATTPEAGAMFIVPDPVPAGYPAGSNPGDGLVYNGTTYDNVGPIRGPAGPAGPDGADGADGAAATVMAGSVTMAAPGSPATVTNSGTTSAAVFDFVIPEAYNGQDGAPGADGANAEVYKQLAEPTAQRVGALWLVMA